MRGCHEPRIMIYQILYIKSTIKNNFRIKKERERTHGHRQQGGDGGGGVGGGGRGYRGDKRKWKNTVKIFLKEKIKL